MGERSPTFVPLGAIGGAPSAAEIEQAIAPFLVEGDDRRWRAALARRGRKTILRAARRALRLSGRSKASIEREYRQAWGAGYERYRLGRTDLKPSPWIWRDRRLLLDQAAATRMRMLLFASVIARLKPRRVLEVGCGNGINMLTLAGAFPDIEFTGLDLTDEGIAQARRAQSDPAILDIVESYSPLERYDRDSVGRIRFVQGSAADLPFEDESFDLVMTVLAVEQMEGIRDRALSEIARVSGGHTLMLEPFGDCNAGGMRGLYVYARDYFRGRIRELRDHGLQPSWATNDYPEEAFLGTALVLSSKD